MSTEKQERRIEYMALGELKPAKKNPKLHAEEALGKSMGRFGFTEPLLLDERTGRLVAGHGRLEQVRKLFEAGEHDAPPGVRVSLTDPKGPHWMVPVVRGWSSQNDKEADAYLLASNQLTAVGGWDEEQLAEMLRPIAEAGPVDALGWTKKELDALLKSTGADSAEDDREMEVPEPVSIYVQSGDLWELGGNHRLLVGDSMDPVDMAKLTKREIVHLVATDPPYGIYGSSTGVGGDITDDKMVQPFYEKLTKLAFDHLHDFSHAYFFCDWRSWSALWVGARRSGLSGKNLLVWDKGGGLGSSYSNTYELIGFFAKLPPKKTMTAHDQRGQRTVSRPNLMRFNRPTGDDRQHNAAKPVELMRELIRNSSEPGQVVLEPFAGSGTTLIAAEREGRTCYAMEMEPKFAQVILERFKLATGKDVKKL